MQIGPRTLIFIMLLLAMPIAAYMLMFKPLDERLSSAREEIRQKNEKLASLNTAMAGQKNLAEEIEKLKKALEFLQGKLPEEKEMDKVLKEVWQIAEKNGLNTKSVRSLKATYGASYSEQPIRMVIVGAFSPGFFNFLKEVEALPRLTRIAEMKIDKDEKTSGMVTADLVLTVYFERQSQKVAVAQ